MLERDNESDLSSEDFRQRRMFLRIPPLARVGETGGDDDHFKFHPEEQQLDSLV